MQKMLNTGIKFSVTTLAVISLSGCLGPAVKPSVTQMVALEKASILPTESELNHEIPKVVVFPLKSSDEMVEKFNLGDVAASSMEQSLINASVEVVDRSLLKELQAEIEKAEFEGLRSDSVNNSVANYVLVGNISSVTVGSSFTERRVWQDKEGKTHVSPPYCRYTGQMTGLYKLVTLANGKVAANFKLQDSVSSKTETSDSSCRVTRGTESNLAKGAVVDAIEGAEYELKNFFSPKGYVVNAQETPDGKKFFVQISIGSEQNVKPGDDVLFYELRSTTNQLTGKVSEEEVQVGEGKVLADITQNEAWVEVDSDYRQLMKLGAVAKIDNTSIFKDTVKDLKQKLKF